MNYIYKITNLINNKIYIGKAKDIQKRFERHINASFKETDPGYENPIHRAIRKYGTSNFIIEQIDQAESLKNINKKEKY